jgi:hypothetical protein
VGSGVDIAGRPVICLKSGRFPVARRNLDDVLAGVCALVVHVQQRYGTHCRTTVLYDRTGFVKSDNLDIDLIRGVASLLSDQSPETLEAALIYPCGWLLRSFWKIVKWFFDPITRDKIQMLGTPEDFQSLVAADQLMDDMGGRSGFAWPENDEARWRAFVATLPDLTVDNWQDPHWEPTQAGQKTEGSGAPDGAGSSHGEEHGRKPVAEGGAGQEEACR